MWRQMIRFAVLVRPVIRSYPQARVFGRRPLRLVVGVVFGVVVLSLLGGGVAGADSSAPGWAGLGAPLAPGQVSGQDLYAISCPTASRCAAVGDYGSASGVRLLAMEGAGGAWTPATLTPPSDFQPSNTGEIPHLASVSCSSVGNCAAVGSYPTAPDYDYLRRMLVVEVGGVWQGAVQAPALSDGPAMGTFAAGPEFSPNPGDQGTLPLQKVSCSAQLCLAVGQYRWGHVHTPQGTRTSTEGLIVSGSGSGDWTSLTAPLPGNANAPGPDASLNDVSCVGSECGAGGMYRDSSGQEQGLLVADSNGTLTAVEAPLPANAATTGQYARVEAISCPAAGECSAAGSYLDSSGASQPLLLSETGGVWSATEGTLPAGTAHDPQTLFFSVSCSQPGECAAVGTDFINPGTIQQVPLAVAERSGSWDHAVNPHLPLDAIPFATNPRLGGGQSSWLNTVSCPSAGHCEAGGTYIMKNTDFHPLLVELNDTSWTAAGIPLPNDALVTTSGDSAQPGSVWGLSCFAGVGCDGVGTYSGPIGHQHDHALIVVSGNPAIGVAKAARATTAGTTAAVTVACLGQSSCGVAFNLKHGTTVIGRATGTVAAHTRTMIPVALNAQGQRLLRRTPQGSKLQSSLTVTERTLIVSNQKPLFKHS